MEVKLENLIEKIKKEGVEGAQKESEKIISKAREEARSIISDAEKDAEAIIEDAKKSTAKLEENAGLAIKQAARDSELLLKERFTELCDEIFKQEISDTLTPDFLKELILKIITQWSKNPEMEITLNKKDKTALEKQLIKSLKGKLKESITLRLSSDISSGFRIGLKGEDVYYDFSDEAFGEMLKLFLNPRIREILDKKNG
jgi:V/A-type H+-transporting ATPase subunit E